MKYDSLHPRRFGEETFELIKRICHLNCKLFFHVFAVVHYVGQGRMINSQFPQSVITPLIWALKATFKIRAINFHSESNSALVSIVHRGGGKK